MADLWIATLVSFGVIFVAELGDKSQLMALVFATRFKAWQVVLGITVATTIVHLASVAIGHGLGAALPTSWISVAAAVAFFGFAAWTLRGDSLTDEDRNAAVRLARFPVVAVGVAFLLAELGDKTMLATITLAADYDWAGVWIGSTVGMVAADALAITAGWYLRRQLREHIIRYAAAALFVVFGIWLLVDGIAELSPH